MTQKNPQDQRTEQYPEDRPGNPGHGKDRQNRQDQEQKKNEPSGQGNSNDDERGEPGMQRPGQGGTERTENHSE